MSLENSGTHIAIFLPNLAGGGVERAYLELANSISQRGCRVDLVLAEVVGPYVREIPSNVNIVELASAGKFRQIARLAKYLRSIKPMVILSGGDITNAVALVSSMLAGRTSNCVISQRAAIRVPWMIQRPKTWVFWLPIFGFLFRRARAIISNSEFARNELIEVMGVRPERCSTIYNAIDCNKIQQKSNESIQDPWIEKSSLPVIVSIGSLSPRKDMATIITAFKLVRESIDVHLVILGDGPERGRLEVLIEKLGLVGNVHMPGFVENPFPILKRACLFVSASHAEGCPNVIQQALACGTPIVATDCPGATAELLGNGIWGKLVSIANAEEMASAITDVISNSKFREGKKRALEFPPEETTNAYLKILLV